MNTSQLMEFHPSQPLAVVIGAGGMGMAVARRLGQHNHIVVADVDASKLERQAERLREEGVQVTAVACDITDAASVARLAEKVRELGPLSKLAHVTGLSPSMADWRTIMAVNLIGPALVADALRPLALPGAAAVVISSLSAHLGPPDDNTAALLDQPLSLDFLDRLAGTVADGMTPQLSYSWSKFGVIRLCQRLAVSWGAQGARVVSLSPGLIATPQGTSEFKHAKTKLGLLQKCPLQRQGGVLEIADVVEFLLSERASYINGVDLLVDGGLQARLATDRTGQ